jgi:hypothetical protein
MTATAKPHAPSKSAKHITEPVTGPQAYPLRLDALVTSFEHTLGCEQISATWPIRDVVSEIVPLFVASIQTGRIEELRRAAQVYRPQVEIRLVDTQLMEMQKTAAESILRGAEWLTALQVGALAGRSASNPAALANRWKREGKLFSISWNGKDWYPRYAFDDVVQPRPVIADVIKILGADMDPWRIAAWFESANAWLDDHKPHELITETERIVAAARKKGGWQHG